MARVDERRRATQLKVLDVRQLISASLPAVVPLLNATHLDHLQRVLDGASINADVQRQWGELDRQSIKGKIVHSNEYLRDEAAVARRDKVLSQRIAVGPDENAVLLDVHSCSHRTR